MKKGKAPVKNKASVSTVIDQTFEKQDRPKEDPLKKKQVSWDKIKNGHRNRSGTYYDLDKAKPKFL
jgi:hypothetical protein